MSHCDPSPCAYINVLTICHDQQVHSLGAHAPVLEDPQSPFHVATLHFLQVIHFHGAFIGIPVSTPIQEREEASGLLEEGG